MPEPTFVRVPSLLGPIFEEATRGDRQMREALFLTFNVDLGFFETRLLGPARATGAAVTVIADSNMFAPDPRNVRSAGQSYAFGLAAMSGAFHPKLTILVGEHRALIGIGSGNLTIGGWHANDEVLTSVQAGREQGAPLILRDLLKFLRELPGRLAISPLAVEGIGRTADQLQALVDAAEPIDTGHRLLDSVQGPILQQLPAETVDELELSAPFHDLKGNALKALINRYQPRRVTILAQPGQAVMDPAALQREAAAAGCQLSYVQLAGDEAARSPYRHGKVITGLRSGSPVWSLVGSPNISAAAILGAAPSSNCELAVLHFTDRSLFPAPTVPVADIPALLNKVIDNGTDETGDSGVSGRFLEARAVDKGIQVALSRPAVEDLLVEISPFHASPEDFRTLGILAEGSSTAVFAGHYDAGSRVRISGQIQFVADPGRVVERIGVARTGRPNNDLTVSEIFSSDVAAAQWHNALARLVLTHRQTAKAGPVGTSSQESPSASSWRTLEDADAWGAYAENALESLGMPIFQFALGASPASRPVGASLPNTAPAWEDNFDEIGESFESDDLVEGGDPIADLAEERSPADLSPGQRGRLRRWVKEIVTLMPQLGPLEQIAVCQLAIAGSSALIWDTHTGANGWFDPLASALDEMNRDDWPDVVAPQAASVATVGVYRLRMAIPPDERGTDAARFLQLTRSLKHLTDVATPELIDGNLALLAGTTLIGLTTEDVVTDLAASASLDPRAGLSRILDRVLPGFDLEWIDDLRLLVTGSATNPRAIALEVLKHAGDITHLAIGVNGSGGNWSVLGKVPGRLTLVVGGNVSTTFKTYDTSYVSPVSVLTNQELGKTHRVSSVPFTQPGAVDLEVLQELNLGEGQMQS